MLSNFCVRWIKQSAVKPQTTALLNQLELNTHSLFSYTHTQEKPLGFNPPPRQLLPWLDILSILPFYLELLLLAIGGMCMIFAVSECFSLARCIKVIFQMINVFCSVSCPSQYEIIIVFFTNRFWQRLNCTCTCK